MEIIITAVGRDAQFSPPREFFERPAVPFIVFHLLDTVQSIHASLKISSLPPPPPSLPPFSRDTRIQNNPVRTHLLEPLLELESNIIRFHRRSRSLMRG